MGNHPDARRAIMLVYFLDDTVNAVEDAAGIFPSTHEHNPLHGIVVIAHPLRAVEQHADAAKPHRITNHYAANIADANRSAVAAIDGDGGDVGRIAHKTEPAHDIHF